MLSLISMNWNLFNFKIFLKDLIKSSVSISNLLVSKLSSFNLLDTKHLNSDWLSVIFLLKSKLIKKVIDLFPNSLTGKTALFENLSLDFSKFRNLDPIT